jgi:uncharacterized protein
MRFAPTRLAAAALMIAVVSLAAVTGSDRATAQKAAVDPAALALAKDVMVAAGAAQQFESVVPMMMGQMANAMASSAPPDKAQIIKDVMKMMTPKFIERKQELLDQVAVIYAQNLSMDDMKGVLAFYNSPTGKKLIASQPTIQQQSMLVGQAWGQKLGMEMQQDIVNELKKRGVQ